MLKSKSIKTRPISFKSRTKQEWMDIIIPPLNGKEYFKRSQEKSGGQIARHSDFQEDTQMEHEQLYRDNRNVLNI